MCKFEDFTSKIGEESRKVQRKRPTKSTQSDNKRTSSELLSESDKELQNQASQRKKN